MFVGGIVALRKTTYSKHGQELQQLQNFRELRESWLETFEKRMVEVEDSVAYSEKVHVESSHALRVHLESLQAEVEDSLQEVCSVHADYGGACWEDRTLSCQALSLRTLKPMVSRWPRPNLKAPCASQSLRSAGRRLSPTSHMSRDRSRRMLSSSEKVPGLGIFDVDGHRYFSIFFGKRITSP